MFLLPILDIMLWVQIHKLDVEASAQMGLATSVPQLNMMKWITGIRVVVWFILMGMLVSSGYNLYKALGTMPISMISEEHLTKEIGVIPVLAALYLILLVFGIVQFAQFSQPDPSMPALQALKEKSCIKTMFTFYYIVVGLHVIYGVLGALLNKKVDKLVDRLVQSPAQQPLPPQQMASSPKRPSSASSSVRQSPFAPYVAPSSYARSSLERRRSSADNARSSPFERRRSSSGVAPVSSRRPSPYPSGERRGLY